MNEESLNPPSASVEAPKFTSVRALKDFDHKGKTYLNGGIVQVPTESVDKLLKGKFIAHLDSPVAAPSSMETRLLELLADPAAEPQPGEDAVATLSRVLVERDNYKLINLSLLGERDNLRQQVDSLKQSNLSLFDQAREASARAESAEAI